MHLDQFRTSWKGKNTIAVYTIWHEVVIAAYVFSFNIAAWFSLATYKHKWKRIVLVANITAPGASISTSASEGSNLSSPPPWCLYLAKLCLDTACMRLCLHLQWKVRICWQSCSFELFPRAAWWYFSCLYDQHHNKSNYLFLSRSSVSYQLLARFTT